MNTAKQLNDVSAFYFYLMAFVYIFSALAIRNGMYTDIATLLIRVLDVPFALVALIYGGSSLHLQIAGERDEDSPWTMGIYAVCIILFAGVTFFNFAFPSTL